MNQKILVIRFGSLGDVVLASAPVLNLKIHYPLSQISFLTKTKHAEIARMIPGVDNVIETSNSPGLKEYLKLLYELENENFDIIIDLQGNARSFLARNLITAPQKFVYARDRSLRNRVVRLKDFPQTITHTIDKYNECIKQLGHYPAAKRPVLDISQESARMSRRHQIVIAPGASYDNKQWPIERFSELALELAIKLDTHIVWAITSDDKDKTNIIEKLGAENVSILIDSPIERLAGIINQSELCIANDSGIAHLSSAVGTPVVAIFGPTHPALGFAPRGLNDKVIEVDEYCRPCSLHGDKRCFRTERFCFTRISVEAVRDASVKLFKQVRASSKCLFVDRDGTVIVDKPFDSNPDNIEFEDGSVEALKSIKQAGYKIVIVSNQSGIARGYFKYAAAERFNAELAGRLKKHGVEIDAVYFCPHYANGKVPEYSYNCNCRKPAPQMVENAARDLNINLRKSYVVGDKIDDYNLGRVAGMKSFLVRTGQGMKYIKGLENISGNPDYDITDNLLEAVNRILKSEKTVVAEP